MIETSYAVIEDADIIQQQTQHWSQQLQRRVMRLLLLHDPLLFRQQFRLFFAESALPTIPLLQQYDRYIKFQTLSNELLDDILPRIRRQLSLKTNQIRLTEEAPTRGEIDWLKTIAKSWNETPGLPPQHFETRRRQHSMETPENILTVAIVLAFRQQLQQLLDERLDDEEFRQQEKQALISADERAERELAASYARLLASQAQRADISQFVQRVASQLRPGPNPYRDLLHWWQRFTQFRIGRTVTRQQANALATTRTDEKMDAWLYELWIALELIHHFQEHNAVQPQDVTIATDMLQCTFTWQGRHFRFIYNRQLDTMTGFASDWEHGPSSRPDYTLERERPLEIRHNGTLIWREPAVILDAKYYLGGSDPIQTHGPIKKILGDMSLLDAQTGALFFPQLPEPAGNQQYTRVIRRSGTQYQATASTQQIYLYHLDPAMPFPALQQRLQAILDLAVSQLPERPQPVCMGTLLDTNTANATQHTPLPHTILCPKPHIGPGIFDLVNIDTDCLQNPRVCHVIGQPILLPHVINARTREQLAAQSTNLRAQNSKRLQAAESGGDEERAEQIRTRILNGVGQAIEHYVQQTGNTKSIEENFKHWIFNSYWQDHRRCLAETTRHALVSGEYVWQQYQEVSLQDWAAPAIQYCRALEHELKRRLYTPCAHRYPPNKSGFTLGTVDFAYKDHQGKGREIWSIFTFLVKQSGSSVTDFEHIIKQLCEHKVKEKRNQLAHGGMINMETAQSLREIVIGTRSQPGILSWLVEHLSPASPY